VRGCVNATIPRQERAVLTAWPLARAGRHAPGTDPRPGHAPACFQELSALPPKGDQRSRLSVMVCHRPTPAASFWRTPPSRPRASPRSRAWASASIEVLRRARTGITAASARQVGEPNLRWPHLGNGSRRIAQTSHASPDQHMGLQQTPVSPWRCEATLVMMTLVVSTADTGRIKIPQRSNHPAVLGCAILPVGRTGGTGQ
jgi:hypothetical protein